MSKIAQRLNTLFDDHRIILWYDEGGSLKDEFNSLEIEASKIELNNNEFGIKVKVLYEDREGKYLIYSANGEEVLQKKNIQNNICFKETRKMTKEQKDKQKEDEKPKHKIRARVEHRFALIKATMQQSITRFTGLLRNNLNFTITCIAVNLKLFAHKQIKLQKVASR